MSQPQTKPPGPPYAPQVWSLGGHPTKTTDIPIQSVFLVLFIISAVAHMTILQLNQRKGHKFLMSGLLFGFSMARIVTSIIRIASISLPHDVSLAIAAAIFTAAGVLLVFVINLIFTQRIMRASHPTFGWHKAFSLAFKIIYALIVVLIIMLITAVVQTFYTLNPKIRRIDRDIQLAGITYFAFVSFLPIPIILFGLVIPRHHGLDKFGHGRWRTKIRILLLSSTLVSFGAIYRAATTWMTPKPLTDPMPYYFHKAAFYIVNFGVEITVLYLYAILRIDRRFWIPNGARGYGSYAGNQRLGSASQGVRTAPTTADGKTIDRDSSMLSEARLASRVYSEEETFDGDEYAEKERRQDEETGTLDSPVEKPETAHFVKEEH